MSSIIETVLYVLTQRRNEPSSPLLPSNIDDIEAGGILASDLLTYLDDGDDDNIELREVLTEEQLALRAYSAAKHQSFRDEVYIDDFFKNFSARVPTENNQDTTVVWRIDADNPVVTILVEVLGAEPIHVIDDIYGEQVIFKDNDVQVAVNHLVELCGKYDLIVTPRTGDAAAAAAIVEKDSLEYTTINL